MCKQTLKHILETSSHGASPPGFPLPSGSQCARCRRQEIRGTDPLHLEDWEPWWALEESKDGGIKYSAGKGRRENKKQSDEKVNAGKTLNLVSLTHTTHSTEATCHRVQLKAVKLLLNFKRQ